MCMQCDREDDALSCNGLQNQHFCLLCYQLTTKSVEMFYSISPCIENVRNVKGVSGCSARERGK